MSWGSCEVRERELRRRKDFRKRRYEVLGMGGFLERLRDRCWVLGVGWGGVGLRDGELEKVKG